MESGEGIESHSVAGDFAMIELYVESGEGIERLRRDKPRHDDAHRLWNPVKELKDVMRRKEGERAALVESGEGIER